MEKQELQREGQAWLAAQLRWEARLVELRRSTDTPTSTDVQHDLAA